MLLLAAGRECTDLFASYHALSKDRAKLEKYLKMYEIGETTGPTEFPVYAPDTRGFYTTLSSRVNAYFDRTGYDPKAPITGAWARVACRRKAVAASVL